MAQEQGIHHSKSRHLSTLKFSESPLSLLLNIRLPFTRRWILAFTVKMQ